MEMQPLLEMDFRTSVWELSPYKKAQWTLRNDLLISKKTISGGTYKVYVTAEACKGIAEKQQEILVLMEQVKMGKLPNPTIMRVSKMRGELARIVQVSLYNGAPKFGIHIQEDSGQIAVCKGLNLTPGEFDKLLNMFEVCPPIVHSPLKTSFSLRMYSWTWTLGMKMKNQQAEDGVEILTNGKWYLYPEVCFNEAIEASPEGPYKLETFSKLFDYSIDSNLVDAAAARAILYNIDMTKTYELMNNRMPLNDGELLNGDELGADVNSYGKTAFGDVNMRQIYGLLYKLISISENPHPSMHTSVMNELANRGKLVEQLDQLKMKGSEMLYLSLFEQLDAE